MDSLSSTPSRRDTGSGAALGASTVDTTGYESQEGEHAMRSAFAELHRLHVGQSTYPPIQYRSLDQAARLIDPLHREQTRWRAEHLALAAEQGRLDAQLHYAATTTDSVEKLAAARSAAWEAVWGDHTEQWSAERREWEMTYAMDGANRGEEREAYLSAYTSEQRRLAHHPPDGAADTTALGRDGARTGVYRLRSLRRSTRYRHRRQG